MKRARYSVLFVALVVGHTAVALASYRALSSLAGDARREDTTLRWPDDTLPTRAAAKANAVDAALDAAEAYARLEAADAEWRQKHAKQYTLAELRARGDGRRSPRQAMQDRVYKFTRAGDKARAIQELRQWVRANGRDANAMLWLARLLHEEGRSGEAVPLYRRAIAIENASSSGER